MALPCLGERSGHFADHFLALVALCSVSLQKDILMSTNTAAAVGPVAPCQVAIDWSFH